jgi:diaminopropionate ammonia-lyase
MAALTGLRATVFVPSAMVEGRRAAIAGEGAEVVVVDGSYDDAVRRSSEQGASDPAARAVDDADLDGSGLVARGVIDGYGTLFAEAAEQLPTGAVPDTVLLQTGVGAFAAAGVRFAAEIGAVAIAVDPTGAPCIATSLAAGERTSVETRSTAMAGLDAGTPSAAAWPLLAEGLGGAIVVDDDEADEAMRDLASLGVAAGESGAAGLAGLRALLEDERCRFLQPAHGVRRALVVVTEGATDPERRRRVLAART